MDLAALGRVILVIAGVLVLLGLLLLGLGKLGLGRLPGDIVYHRDGVTIYFPIVTSILLSILLSLLISGILWLLHRGR